MAEVYLATTTADTHLRKTVAIKRILRQFSQSSEFIKMFYEEAKIALQLRHKNIVTVYDFGIDRGHPYIVMEFLPGKSLQVLRTRLLESQQTMPVQHALYLIKEIASGLSYFHRLADPETGHTLGLVHRDISPQNIILGGHGDVKIIDFGVAKSNISDGQSRGGIKGKFGYLSPEQLTEEELDGRSDLFSLGVIFFEILFNRKLFSFNSDVEYISQLKNFQSHPGLLSDKNIDPQVAHILLKLLMPDRDSRYHSAQDVMQDITIVLNQIHPGYTEYQFSQFINEWVPMETVSLSQSIKTPAASSDVKIIRRYVIKTPQGSVL